jgi:predicted metal-dependent phosphotriesterase family hydrolase
MGTASVTTVGGPVMADELGITLPHEHLFINLMRDYRLAGLLNDPEVMAEEVDLFSAAGGGTIVDVTTAEITRGANGGLLDDEADRDMTFDDGTRAKANVLALQELSERTGVHVVAGTGHYRDPYLDKDWVDRMSTDRIAEQIVRDIEEGFPGTSVRAGIIGEVGSDQWFISAAEERCFRAAARAHRRTGATITTHATRWPVGLAQVELLLAEGVDPGCIIVGHTDTVPDVDYAIRLARQGVYVQLDLFFECMKFGTVNHRALKTRVDMIMHLVRNGFQDSILLSHDICLKDSLASNGGPGFTFILTHVSDALVQAGLDAELVTRFQRENPNAALSAGAR